MAAAGRGPAEVALWSMAVSLLSSLAWNLGGGWPSQCHRNPPRVTVGSGQALGWAGAWLLIPALGLRPLDLGSLL